MKGAILPIVIFTVLMFTAVEGPQWFTAVYYTVVCAAVWTMHSLYVVPYEALGAEIVQNTQGRTALRSYARFFMSLGNIFGLVIVLKLVETIESRNATPQTAWQLTALIIAAVSGLTCLLTCVILSEKKAMVPMSCKAEQPKHSILNEYLQVIGLKPFRYLLTVTLLFCISNIFFSSTLVYFMKYNLGLSENAKPLVFLAMTFSGLTLTPVLSKLSSIFDKKYVMFGAYLFSGIGMRVLGTAGITSVLLLCVYAAVFTVGASSYWQLMYSVVYDISEVDEWHYHKRREGIIMSSSKIFLRISSAVSVQLLAVVLYCFGYVSDSAVQSETALHGIGISLTWIPAVFYILASIGIYLYPLSREKHNELIKNIEERSRLSLEAGQGE
jgi:GPH family glycoside/pentoside/hexuronide:cation symporter